MVEDDSKQGDGSLPPKLNLRESVLNQGSAPDADKPAAAKPVATPKPAAPVAATPAPAPKPAMASPQAKPVVPKPMAPAAAPGAMRIDAPKTPAAAAAPKPIVAKKPVVVPAASAPAGNVSPTIKFRPAQGAAASRTAAKKETSKIPLDAAKPTILTEGAEDGQAPKTIRIKPTKAPSAIKPMAIKPMSVKPAATGVAVEKPSDEKSKTSRISLEAALSPEEDKTAGSDAAGPRTIRLKRPAEQATIRVAPAPSSSKLPIGKTTQLEAVPDEEEGITPTRRKTIKVKKPTAAKGVKSGGVKVAKAAPAGAAAPVAFRPQVDKPNLFFHLWSIAAIIVLGVTIWMFLAQLYGRDLSLTQLSYGLYEDLNLPWSGKIYGGFGM
jgi:hypothetical protein